MITNLPTRIRCGNKFRTYNLVWQVKGCKVFSKLRADDFGFVSVSVQVLIKGSQRTQGYILHLNWTTSCCRIGLGKQKKKCAAVFLRVCSLQPLRELSFNDSCLFEHFLCLEPTDTTTKKYATKYAWKCKRHCRNMCITVLENLRRHLKKNINLIHY